MSEFGPPKVLLVGCGKMGQAMLAGWLAGGVVERVVAVDPNIGAETFAHEKRVTLVAEPNKIPDGFKPDIVVLAVKPQMMGDAVPGCRPFVEAGAVVLSIAAGKTLAGFAAKFGANTAAVRAMPNTPAAIGRGITVAVANSHVSSMQHQACEALLAAVGIVEWVEDEGLIDAVTAVSGGGPAYVFLLIEALAAAGAKVGLPPDLAMKLARVTVSGAGELARLSHEPAAQLRQNVTSPKGTTLEALNILMGEDGMLPLFEHAIAAATARSRALADG